MNTDQARQMLLDRLPPTQSLQWYTPDSLLVKSACQSVVPVEGISQIL